MNLIPFVKIIFYIIFGFLFYKLSLKIIFKRISKLIGKKKEDESRRKTILSVFRGIIKWSLILVVILLSLAELKINIAPILTGAGLLGFAISFASRDLIADYLSGLSFLLEDQFRVGEKIFIGSPINQQGEVIDFDLRKVVIKTKENDIVFVRNSKITFIINKSRTSF